MLLHLSDVLLGQQLVCFSLSHNLHNFKGHRRVQPVVNQIQHDAVTGTDYLTDVAGAAFDEILRIAQPYVGAVGQTGNLQQIRKILRLTIQQHLPDKRRAHLRDGKGAGFAVDLLRCHTQHLRRGEQAVHLLVRHIRIGDLGVGQILHVLVQGRHIVPEDVQLENGVVQRVKIEVGGDDVRIDVVRRMLDRGKIEHIVIIRHNDHAARVLTGGALDPGAAFAQAVFLRFMQGHSPLVQVVFYITIGGLIGKRTGGPRLKDVSLSEQLLGVLVCLRLVLTGKVQVNIRRLVPVEAQKGFKRNVVTIPQIRCATVFTVFRRQVKARTDRAVGKEDGVIAVWTAVVRRQRIYLRDARHDGDKGGTNRTTRAY